MSFSTPPGKIPIEEITLSSDSEDETPGFSGSSLHSNYYRATDARPSSSRPNFPNAVSVIIRPPSQNSSYKTFRVLPPRVPPPAPPSETSSSGESSLSPQRGTVVAAFEGPSCVGDDQTETSQIGSVAVASCAADSPASDHSETTSAASETTVEISDSEMDESGQSLSTIDKDLFASLGNDFVNNVGNLVENRAKLEKEAEEEAQKTKELCENLERATEELEQMNAEEEVVDVDMEEAEETAKELQAAIEKLTEENKNLDARRDLLAGALGGARSQLQDILRDAEWDDDDDYDSEPEQIHVKCETGTGAEATEASPGSPQPGTSQGNQSWASLNQGQRLEEEEKEKKLIEEIDEKQKEIRKGFKTLRREEEATIRMLTNQRKQLLAEEARFKSNYPSAYQDTTEDDDDDEEPAEKMDE